MVSVKLLRFLHITGFAQLFAIRLLRMVDFAMMMLQFNSSHVGVSCWVANSGNPTYNYALCALRHQIQSIGFSFAACFIFGFLV
ncbi:hypothetical protein CXB77_14385 [Chromatium okenii]|jgi:hypothetical protein|uniref:Uncharacterized protein n=1 Tax=Chromatium okenii TaxID=61644 RepID=A0A2S7XPU8_9GAMM|nr:hypothetical protein CXB77_14385 [Chromatium okenii]